MRELVRRLVLSTPERRSRRVRPTAVAGTGWTCAGPSAPPIAPAATRCGWCTPPARTAPRRLVLLCDVSGSMEPYTRIYLTLLQGAVAGARAEAFVFSTRLTRLTRELSGPRPRPGTRAGRATHRRTGPAAPGSPRASAASSPVTAAAGWPAAPSSWCCPTAGRPTTRRRWRRRCGGCAGWRTGSCGSTRGRPHPATRRWSAGMAAALPYCDAFVSGHSLAALEQVVAAVAEERPRTHVTAGTTATVNGEPPRPRPAHPTPYRSAARRHAGGRHESQHRHHRPARPRDLARAHRRRRRPCRLRPGVPVPRTSSASTRPWPTSTGCSTSGWPPCPSRASAHRLLAVDGLPQDVGVPGVLRRLGDDVQEDPARRAHPVRREPRRHGQRVGRRRGRAASPRVRRCAAATAA